MNLSPLTAQFQFRWQRAFGALVGVLLILVGAAWLLMAVRAYQTPVPASLDTYALLVTPKDWMFESAPRLPVAIVWIPIMSLLVPVSLWSVRRSLRRRSNRCTQCAYSLEGLPAASGGECRCPECGSQNRFRGVDL